jgi:recombination protein RecR
MADPIARLARHLARLPGVGEKTATRLAMHLVTAPASHARDLAAALVEAIEATRLCSLCMNLTEDDPCRLCADRTRDASLLCVVATPADVMAIDRAGEFRGRYHVLHGLLSPLEGVSPEDLRIAELIRRLAPGSVGDECAAVEEVILATSAGIEGEATAFYLARLIKPLGVAVSRIASGIPVGGELEYSDRATIARALEGRSRL